MNLDTRIEPVCDVPQWVRGDSGLGSVALHYNHRRWHMAHAQP